MKEAQAALGRLWNSYRDLQAAARDAPSGDVSEAGKLVQEARANFVSSMDDDFNTRAAIEGLFELARSANKMMAEHTLTKEGAALILGFLKEVDGVLGIYPQDEETDGGFDAVMQVLIDLRKELRARKQYDLADMIRDRLKEAGYALEDTADGAKWKKI